MSHLYDLKKLKKIASKRLVPLPISYRPDDNTAIKDLGELIDSVWMGTFVREWMSSYLLKTGASCELVESCLKRIEPGENHWPIAISLVNKCIAGAKMVKLSINKLE